VKCPIIRKLPKLGFGFAAMVSAVSDALRVGASVVSIVMGLA
jgi:hypothetical protein